MLMKMLEMLLWNILCHPRFRQILHLKSELFDANLPTLANATKGVDYQDVTGEFVTNPLGETFRLVTIPPGETSGSILIPIIDDSLVEPAEHFRVDLTEISHGSFPIENPEVGVKLFKLNKVTILYFQ